MNRLFDLSPSKHPGNVTATAVLYLRVSTREQATRGGEAEGFSIPAQREACFRRAEQLGVVVVEEFIDAGESARSTRRPNLHAMLSYIEEHAVQFVIVHKLDRLARNRADDVAINLAIQRAGTTLVSVSENIDETPSGQLLHGIMADIAQFYSANLANEVMKGLLQKARTGGTIGKAYLGYLNVRESLDGAERRTVEIDPDRGPLLAWAFEAYATGDWTLKALRNELLDRGLTTVPTAQRPAKPISVSQLHRYLRSSYYIGKVTYGGIEYAGSHRALVSEEVWYRVQELLTSRSVKGEKHRTHDHYLKSTLYCGHCQSRMIVSHNTNRHGTTYPYFVCVGRHQKRTSCMLRAARIEIIERRVEDLFVNLSLGADQGTRLQTYLSTEFERLLSNRQDEVTRWERQQERLRGEQLRLLQAHYAGAIPLDLLKAEQARITGQLERVERQLASQGAASTALQVNLGRAIAWLTDLDSAYRRADEKTRRQINQALFERIEVTEDDCLEGVLKEPYAALLDTSLASAADHYQRQSPPDRVRPPARTRPLQVRPHVALRAARHAGGVKETRLAEGVGFEPTMGVTP
jgi:site-specific DNA recombinase